MDEALETVREERERPEMGPNGARIAVAICCVGVPLLFVFGPVTVLALAGIAVAAAVLSRGGKLEQLADVVRRGFGKQDS